MNEFVISEAATLLEEYIRKNKNNIKVQNSQFPMDSKRIYLAFLKLCKAWNDNEKSRNFVRTLINKFLPFDSNKKVEEFTTDTYDAILKNVKLAGMKDIELVINRLSKFVDFDEESNQRIDKINTYAKNQPVEIMRCDFGYWAAGTDKVLCRESIYALQKFVSWLVSKKDPIMLQIISKINSKQKSKNTLGNMEDAQKLRAFATLNLRN